MSVIGLGVSKILFDELKDLLVPLKSLSLINFDEGRETGDLG